MTAQRPLERPRDSRLMRNAPYAIAALFVLAVGAVLYFRAGETRREASEVQPPPPQHAEPGAPAGAHAQQPPAEGSQAEIRHPLPRVAELTGAAPLPPLSDSDDAMRQAFVSPLAKQIVGDLVITKDIARRIVATVDNLPRQKAGTQLLPFKAPAGQIAISRKGGARLTLSSANSARYAAYVRLAQAVDVKQLVALYVRFYPLFQQAYEELGYPKKYFNDRAVEAIDDLLAAPDVDGPVALVQPKVVYEFADPELEELSAGQKLLIRIGPQNAAAVKAKLRELRRELVADTPALDR